MLNYLVKRIASLIPLLFGITIISFLVMHLAPGKPSDLQTELNPKISKEARLRIERLYGLDKPLYMQYLNWVSKTATFDFGRSFTDDRKVIDKIAERLPITLTIQIMSLLLILLIAIPIGVFSAARYAGFFDRSMTLFVFIGFAMPTFWLALLLMDFFGVKMGWLPISGITSVDFDRFSLFGKIMDLKRHLVLPIFVSAFGSLAGISRYMRSSMLEVLGQDYIRTARAKGLSEGKILYKHALRNAILPIVTILGLSLPGLIGASVIFESIFAIPGMGRLFYDSVMSRDYPVIMALLTITALLTLLGNLLADVAYAYVDPRIRITKD